MHLDDQRIIMIVEDNRSLASLLKDRLEHDDKNFDVYIAHSSEAGLELLESNLIPDIMLVDMMMPGIDGLELIRIIRGKAKFRDTRIIALSNLDEQSIINRAIKNGADSYMVKYETSIQEIEKEIDELISISKTRKKQKYKVKTYKFPKKIPKI